eukprot:snap_masked-scaffold_20-processed-gene-4.43-mRNA-1 protein AED:0.07 eAED:0.07 QI:0/-1/0/1/-1/1/1/0/423
MIFLELIQDEFPEENCTILGEFNEDSFAFQYCNNSAISSSCLNECQVLVCDERLREERGEGSTPIEIFYSVATKVLSFFLLAGFAATVDTKLFFLNFKTYGVYIGLFAQFIMMPFLGFITVLLFQNNIDPIIGVLILITCTCPGGAYSNWFCSMFNADLALSVAMTTVSTTLAGFLMPLNILFYVTFLLPKINDSFASDDSIVANIPYGELMLTLGVVLAGVLSGLMFGFKYPEKQKHANLVGNVAGILLQALGLVVSSTSCAPAWEQDIYVFMSSMLPLPLGILLALAITSVLDLPKPQRVAISIEGAYQNAGIAVAIAVALGSEGRAASVVPVLYGIYEAIYFFSFCFLSVYFGWTLTPRGENFIKWLLSDYQDTIAVSPLYEKWRKQQQEKLGKLEEETSLEAGEKTSTDSASLEPVQTS